LGFSITTRCGGVCREAGSVAVFECECPFDRGAGVKRAGSTAVRVRGSWSFRAGAFPSWSLGTRVVVELGNEGFGRRLGARGKGWEYT
jgi:hypothetical protein